jgi:hypothetical protein
MKNIVHGFMLSLANFSSIIFAFVIYYTIQGPNQIMIQAPIAVVLYIFFSVCSYDFYAYSFYNTGIYYFISKYFIFLVIPNYN